MVRLSQNEIDQEVEASTDKEEYVVVENGPWKAGRQGLKVWIESDDFTHDVLMVVSGDFATTDDKFKYAEEMCRRLNTHNDPTKQRRGHR
ncbi:hypothetical protein [Ralstonia phage RP13]|nr:hypothetical protein [Ralstonia phage RP13]